MGLINVEKMPNFGVQKRRFEQLELLEGRYEQGGCRRSLGEVR